MKYRRVNGQEIAAAHLKADAFATEQRAYAAETEVARLQALSDDHPSKNSLEKAQEEARRLRLFAIGRCKRAGVKQHEIKQIRRQVVEGWLEQLETNHAQQRALLDDRSAELASAAVNVAEREQFESAIEELREAVEVLERVHVAASRMYDHLGGEEKTDDGVSVISDTPPDDDPLA